MDDYTFELLGVPFGLGADVELEDEGFDPGETTWTTQDVDNPNGPGQFFGTDTLRGATWAFNLFTNMEDAEQAMAAAAALSDAWHDSDIRRPGVVTELRYAVAGRTRLVYGRPRRWSAPPSNRIMGGYIPITCDFSTVDRLHYADEEEAVTLAMAAAPSGGLLLPATAPFLLSGSEQARPGLITNAGTAASGFTARIDGPIVSPYLSGPGWEISMPGLDLLAGQWIDIDTRSWVTSVLRNGVASIGEFTRATRLLDAVIAPGGQEIIFGGTSVTGTATCAVRWRPAWKSL